MTQQRLFYEDAATGKVWVYTPDASGVDFVDIGTAFLENAPSNDSTIYGGSDIDVINGLVLFNGTWKDGTAGQLDVYNINSAATSPYGLTTTMFFSNTSSSAGLDPQDFVNLGGEAYFIGQDANNNATLWETNGTLSGTKELTIDNTTTGSTGAALDHGQMAVFKNELYFNGVGSLDAYNPATGQSSVVGGTAGLNPISTFQAGTGTTDATGSDLFFSDGIKGTANNGVVSQQLAGSGDLYYYSGSGNAVDLSKTYNVHNAEDMVAIEVASKTGYATDIFFNGTDASGKQDLYEISSSAKGTIVSQIATSGSVNSTLGLDPQSITAYDGSIYFEGTDKSLGSTGINDGLWVYTPGKSTTSEVVTSNEGTLNAKNYDLSVGGTTSTVTDYVYNPQSELSVVGSQLYFTATHGSTAGGIFAYTAGSNGGEGSVSQHIGTLGQSSSASPLNLTSVNI